MLTTSIRRSRRVVIRVDADALLDGWRTMHDPAVTLRCVTPLPEDARIVGCAVDPEYPGRLLLCVQSEAFEEVHEGCVPPWFDVQFSREKAHGR
jgi:hypothetical protein